MSQIPSWIAWPGGLPCPGCLEESEFPSEMDTLGDRLELVGDVAVTQRERTQHGPADDRLGGTAGG